MQAWAHVFPVPAIHESALADDALAAVMNSANGTNVIN
jgi:hypothetical protein